MFVLATNRCKIWYICDDSAWYDSFQRWVGLKLLLYRALHFGIYHWGIVFSTMPSGYPEPPVHHLPHPPISSFEQCGQTHVCVGANSRQEYFQSRAVEWVLSPIVLFFVLGCMTPIGCRMGGRTWISDMNHSFSFWVRTIMEAGY